MKQEAALLGAYEALINVTEARVLNRVISCLQQECNIFNLHEKELKGTKNFMLTYIDYSYDRNEYGN